MSSFTHVFHLLSLLLPTVMLVSKVFLSPGLLLIMVKNNSLIKLTNSIITMYLLYCIYVIFISCFHKVQYLFSQVFLSPALFLIKMVKISLSSRQIIDLYYVFIIFNYVLLTSNINKVQYQLFSLRLSSP